MNPDIGNHGFVPTGGVADHLAKLIARRDLLLAEHAEAQQKITDTPMNDATLIGALADARRLGQEILDLNEHIEQMQQEVKKRYG